MNPFQDWQENQTRRRFLSRGAGLLGTAALTGLLSSARADAAAPTHHRPRAKHVIFLHMVGGPSQMDLFDYKPGLVDHYGKDLPPSVRGDQRLTTQTSTQAHLPIAPSKYKFSQAGRCGMWMNTELLPTLAQSADDLCLMRTVNTEAINHEPAICAMQTGNQNTGRPCLGSWASYGLGSANGNLPAFVVLTASPTNHEQEQPVNSRLWSSGFLPGEHSGVTLRGKGDPILFIRNPDGVDSDLRRETLDAINQLNELNHAKVGDPEIRTRIKQYEMAFRMQASVPELADLSQEPAHVFKLYGEEARNRGSFANSVLMARRLVERGVRFVQIYLNNWDHHANLSGRMASQCRDIDRPCHALIEDLKQRGLFEDTLIIWGGEFGRTIYSQGSLSKANYGRDHHPRCFSMWMAGGGTKGGLTFGETDEFSYNVVKDPLPLRDFHATVLHLLGYDHERFTYKYQGLDQKLTGVLPAKVVKALVA